MADAALIFEIDSSQAAGAAKALAGLNKYAAATATVSAKLETQFRKTNGQFQSQVDYIAENERDIRRLAQAYNPALDAQLRFAEAQKEVARAVQLGVIPAEQQAEVLRRLQTQYAMAGVAAGKMGSGVRSNVHHVQNASYQIGDFFVQIASGQNAMMALSQQLPQLLGGFGAIGAAAGAAAAILGAAWMIWGEGVDKAKALEEGMNNLTSSTNSYAEALRNSQLPYQMLIESFGSQAQEASRLYEILARIEKIEFQNSLLSANTALRDQFSDMEGYLNRIVDLYMQGEANGPALLRPINKLKEEFGLTVEQAQSLMFAINDIGANDAPNVVADKMAKVAESLLTAKENGGKVPPELIRLSNEAITAALRVQALTGELNAAAGAAASIQIPAGMNTGNFGALSGLSGSDLLPPVDRTKEATAKPKRGGGGGGAGARAVAQAEKQFQTLRELLEKEGLFQIAEYEKRQLMLENALSKRILTEEQYELMRSQLRTFYFGSDYEKLQLENDMKQEQLELALQKQYITQEQYQQQLAVLRQAEMGQTLGHYNTLFGNMASIAQAGGEKATGIVKAFSIAQGMINSYLAYTQVLADPSLVGRPLLRTVLAASTLASGLAQVANMKSGGSGGSGGAGAMSSASTQPAAPQKQFNIYLNDVPAGLEDFAFGIAKQIIEMQDDGLVNINTGGRR